MKIWLMNWRRSASTKKAGIGTAQNASSSGCQRARRMPAGSGAAAIEPCGEEDQQRYHRCIDDEAADLGHVVLARHVDDAEQDSCDQRALERARAAHHDDHEEVDEVLERESWIQTEDVDRQRAAQPGQPRAEREREAEQETDVDAHADRGLL